MSLLFSPTTLGPLVLKNRIVMAPMTRNRAVGNVPSALMADYYSQRATAGLIITEGTSPSPNGLGYARIPGVTSPEEVQGWARVATAVHAEGGAIFMQLMHCGRIAHPLNMPEVARILAPSALAASGEIFTDQEGLKPNAVPTAMTKLDIDTTVAEYAQAATNAIAAGLDGIELHGANGYLLEQFFRPSSNIRTDTYGGAVEHRARFMLEVVEAVVNAIGADKVGIRLSPFGVFNDMPLYDAIEADYTYLADQLNARGILYVHLVDHSSMGAPVVPDSMKATFRRIFTRTLILSGGYDAVNAELALEERQCDLIAVGRPLLANPDLVSRWMLGSPLNAPNAGTFYTPGAAGYTDYPAIDVAVLH